MDNWEHRRFGILQELHQDRWNEELIGHLFKYTFDKVLTPVEREITSQRVDGKVAGEIAILLGIEIQTVQRHIRTIKKKYRNQMSDRVDNIPELRKRKGFIVRKIKP